MEISNSFLESFLLGKRLEVHETRREVSPYFSLCKYDSSCLVIRGWVVIIVTIKIATLRRAVNSGIIFRYFLGVDEEQYV